MAGRGPQSFKKRQKDSSGKKNNRKRIRNGPSARVLRAPLKMSLLC